MENQNNVLMEADHVKVYFKGRDKKSGTVKAVDDVSFQIMRGETFGVVGESGCGKSTLGRSLVRLLKPTDGHIYLDGTDIAGLKGKELKNMRKKAQIIFQDPSACLNPRRTVKQILMEPFEIHGLKGQMDVDARIEELMHLVGLDTYHLSRYPHELSGGQKQRIGIARALALQPKLIVCDEPVSALDVSIQAQILNLLQDLQKERGLTYIFITHNLSVVNHIADEIAVMYLGSVVEKAPVEELFENPLHPYTKALLSVIPIPEIHEVKKELAIQGEVVSPINLPDECRFYKRCPVRCDACRQGVPALREVSPGHFVACAKCQQAPAGQC